MSEHETKASLEAVWRERSDEELELALAVLGEYNETAREVIRAEAERRPRVCPRCGTSSPFLAAACSCGEALQNQAPPTVDTPAETGRFKGAGCLWAIGGYMAFAGWNAQNRYGASRGPDPGGAAANIMLPGIFFFLAAVLELNGYRKKGPIRPVQWLVLLPGVASLLVAGWLLIFAQASANEKEVLKEFATRTISQRKEREARYQQDFEAIGLNSVLTPEFSAKDTKSQMKESLRRCRAALELVNRTAEEQNRLLESLRDEVRNLPIRSSSKATAESKFLELIEIQRQMHAVDTKLFQEMVSAVEFLRDNKSRWRVEKEQFVFEDQKTLDRYNELSAEIDRLVAEESAITERVYASQAKGERALDELE
jgi:hypothetical protein